ncbi:MAG: Rid family detoxifying hydrolase [Desulfatitalea sp.]
MSDIPDAPKAVGPYSQLSIAGDTIYLSGQLPLDPKTGKLVVGTIEEQTEQIFNNIEAVLKGVGLGLSDVARSSVYLTDMSKFPNMNAIYTKRFGDHKPARETIGVSALALGAAIEITVIAHKRRTKG